jgi:acetyl-CoA C-acetyltransferase
MLWREKIEEMYDIFREASDEFAYKSQMRAKAAMNVGYFEEEIENLRR